jgi:hypothetical protein
MTADRTPQKASIRRRFSAMVSFVVGRPRKVIDAQKVEQLASFGASAAEIAAELNCGERTIERRFGAVLKSGAKKRDLRLRSALFKAAVRGNAPVLIFMAKTCLGMREDPSTVISVTQNANPNPLPNPAEFKARFAAAQKYLEDHQDDVINPRLGSNGQ